MRRAATEQLTGESLICEIVRRHPENAGLATVQRLTDELVLALVAKRHDDMAVRLSALAKLSDNVCLADVAKNGNRDDVRLAAIGRLEDQTALADVAKLSSSTNVGLAAVAKLTGQALLAEVAKTACTDETALAAIAKLDQAMLKVAAESSNSIVCRAVLEKLEDQQDLAHVAKNARLSSVRFAAAEKLTDQAQAQTAYAEVFLNPGLDEYLGPAALGKLTEDTLAALAKRERRFVNDPMPMTALLGLRTQEALADVAKGACDSRIRTTALERLSEQRALADVARNAQDGDIQLAAVDRLDDRTLARAIRAQVEPRVVLQHCLDGTYGTDHTSIDYLDQSSGAMLRIGPTAIREYRDIEQGSHTGDYFVCAGKDGEDHRVRWSDVVCIWFGDHRNFTRRLDPADREQCIHNYGPWQGRGCCVDYPFCSCGSGDKCYERICLLCGNEETSKG